MLKVLMKKKQFYHVSKREGKCFDEKKTIYLCLERSHLARIFTLFVFFQLKLQLIVFVKSIYLVIDYLISKLCCDLINPQQTTALYFDESKRESC